MMPRIEAARVAVLGIAGSGANAVVAGTGAIGLSQQLSQTHSFLYLDLPIWIFFIGVVVLALLGSFASLYTDVMNDARLTASQMAVNLTLGFFSGVIGAFIILPAITAKPPIQIMLITSVSLSFVGTVMIRNIGDLARSPELAHIIKTLLLERIQAIFMLIFDRIEAFISFVLGGRKK